MLTPDPAKQCYHCQGLGHVQADCPTLRLSGGTGGGRCYSCGQMGHLAVRGVGYARAFTELTIHSAIARTRTPHQQDVELVDHQEEATRADTAVDLLATTAPQCAISAEDQITLLAIARPKP